MRDTSLEAYHHIVRTGILGDRRTQVYQVLYYYGPLSSRDVWEKIHAKYSDIPQHSINPRMVELIEIKVIREVGRTSCKHTGREVLLFDVTSHIPREKYSRRNKKLSDVFMLRKALNPFAKMDHTCASLPFECSYCNARRVMERYGGGIK